MIPAARPRNARHTGAPRPFRWAAAIRSRASRSRIHLAMALVTLYVREGKNREYILTKTLTEQINADNDLTLEPRKVSHIVRRHLGGIRVEYHGGYSKLYPRPADSERLSARYALWRGVPRADDPLRLPVKETLATVNRAVLVNGNGATRHRVFAEGETR